MPTSRLPRFKRSPQIPRITITERDNEIIRLVEKHRFLRSDHIFKLIPGSPQQLSRRLQLLFHHGYLERPRAQIEYFTRGGSFPMAYGVGNKGAGILGQKTPRRRHAGEKSRSVGRIYLEHALSVSDFMVEIELACRAVGHARLVPCSELGFRKKASRALGWNVMLGGKKVGVIPDEVFALEVFDDHRNPKQMLFFLEADRGTMPIKRGNLTQSSVRRKLLAYHATSSQEIHRTRFGFDRFKVVVITTTPLRMQALVEACSELKRGHSVFLFADKAILAGPLDLFAPVWHVGRQGKTSGLLNSFHLA